MRTIKAIKIFKILHTGKVMNGYAVAIHHTCIQHRTTRSIQLIPIHTTGVTMGLQPAGKNRVGYGYVLLRFTIIKNRTGNN